MPEFIAGRDQSRETIEHAGSAWEIALYCIDRGAIEVLIRRDGQPWRLIQSNEHPDDAMAHARRVVRAQV